MATPAHVPGRKAGEFTEPAKEAIGAESGYFCSNPSCRISTIAAGSTKNSIGKVGQAAHISGAAPDSARWLPKMDPALRKSADNGIWLCNTHAREIDVDEKRFPIHLLHIWKRRARLHALAVRGGPVTPAAREELVRNTRWLSFPVRGGTQVSEFLADSGARNFWDEERYIAMEFALYELALNATEHGNADRVYLRSRGYRVDLVHNGDYFNPMSLVGASGQRGGQEAIEALIRKFGNNLSLNYRHNGRVATTQLIDAGIAGSEHPCAIATGVLGYEDQAAKITGCSTVHVFPGRGRSYSDGRRLVDNDLAQLAADVIVIHDTHRGVVEFLQKMDSRIQYPSG